MILYLDASALVKRYIQETGSIAVNEWIDSARLLTTGLVTRVEVAAAIARLVRMKVVEKNEAERIVNIFREEWESLVRLPIMDTTVVRADRLSWQHGLRGYDAVHLASALIWRETLARPVHLATYDRELWQAGKVEGLLMLPEVL